MNFAVITDENQLIGVQANDRNKLPTGQRYHPAPDNLTIDNIQDWQYDDGVLIYTGLPVVSHSRFVDLLGDAAMERIIALLQFNTPVVDAPDMSADHKAKLALAYMKVVSIQKPVTLDPNPEGYVYQLLSLCANYKLIDGADIPRILNNQTEVEANG